MARTTLCSESATNWNELEIDIIKLESISAYGNLSSSVSDMIKYHRLKMGWSQFRLAHALELTEKQGRYLIKDYETQGIFPPKELSIKLAKLFNLSTKYFYDDYYEFLDKDYVMILMTWRNNKDLTQMKTAEIIGVTCETYCRWENGHMLNRKNYMKLIKIL
jgi:DNA-binding XRE family transcriptional regulator